MLIEEKGLRILTDPGVYSTDQDLVKGIDIVLITHEHPDHIHIDSLRKVLENNPEAIVISNSEVGKLLDDAEIEYELLEGGSTRNDDQVQVEAFDQQHATVYHSIPTVLNTGYFIANRLFYPGDAFIDPQKPVEILALPVAGPWLRISEAVDYALKIKPKKCFPVHEAILVEPGASHKIPSMILPPEGIDFSVLELGKEYEF